VEKLVKRPEAPAAGALAAEEGREETRRVEAGRRGVEEKENGRGDREEECGRRPADARARCLSKASSRARNEDTGPPATPARTV